MKAFSGFSLITLTILFSQSLTFSVSNQEERVQVSLNKDETADIIVSFGAVPAHIYRVKTAQGIASSLHKFSSKSQATVQSFLSKEKIDFSFLWITNQIFVKNASSNLVKKLSEFPAVTKIEPEFYIELVDPEPPRPFNSSHAKTVEWGVSKIEAVAANGVLEAVLDELNEVRVAVIDTGALHTHEALYASYIGTERNGWLDPIYEKKEPHDDNGHGTHVTGTICGSNGIGVFPQAKWMGCKGCSGSCPSYALTACGQWAICPSGDVNNCGESAHIVSNSWNGGQGQTWFDPVIQAWHAAGIIPIFSAGNTGPQCGTLASPADGDVISVGATTILDSIAYFSATGPSFWGDMKPDITAPGYEVTSAWNSGDKDYYTASGTSMAAPHATGLVAMLKAYKPDLSYNEVKAYLLAGVETKDLVSTGRNCGGASDTVFPNNEYGYGRINALKSLEALIEAEPPVTTTVAPTTTTTTEEPTTTTEEEPETTTPEEPTPTPTGCIHGPFWFPDKTNLPLLICICQASCDQYHYNCYTAANQDAY